MFRFNFNTDRYEPYFVYHGTLTGRVSGLTASAKSAQTEIQMLNRNNTLSALTDAEVEAVADALGAARGKAVKSALAKLNNPEAYNLGKRLFENMKNTFPTTSALPVQAFMLGTFAQWHRQNIGDVDTGALKAAMPFFLQLWNEARDKRIADEKAGKVAAPAKGKRGKLYVGPNGGSGLFPETFASYSRSYGAVTQDSRGNIYDQWGSPLWYAPK